MSVPYCHHSLNRLAPMSFDALVKQLVEAHQREVEQLRAEICSLRAPLTPSPATLLEPGTGDAPPGHRRESVASSIDEHNRPSCHSSQAFLSGRQLRNSGSGVVSLGEPLPESESVYLSSYRLVSFSEPDASAVSVLAADLVSPTVRKWAMLTERAWVYRASADIVLREGWSSIKVQSFTSISCATPQKSVKITAMITEQMHRSLRQQEAKAKRLKKLAQSRTVSLYSLYFRLIRRVMHTRRTLGMTKADQLDTCCLAFILHPASLKRRFWVLASLMLIAYEFFVLTLTPFNIMKGRVATAGEYFSAAFWICDLCVNFFSGIYLQGKVEMRWKIIAKHYLRTWFLFDFLVATTQVLALSMDSNDLNVTFFLRIIRAVRSLRIARVFYWLKTELSLSSYTVTGGKLLQFLAALYLFVHCSACVWFALGKSKDGWVESHEQRLTDSALHNYLVSFHWSLSQLQGNVDIYPGRATGNRLFAVLQSTCSIIALAYFVSSMTDALQDARHQEKRKLDKERLILAFFSRHCDIDPEIRARCEHFLDLQQKQQNTAKDGVEDEQALSLFPPGLQSMLLSEMHSYVLVWHPVFASLQRHHRRVFVQVCSAALSHHFYEPHDDVFSVGEVSHHAHFIVSGEFMINSSFGLFMTVASSWLQTQTNETTRSPRRHAPRRRSKTSQGSHRSEETDSPIDVLQKKPSRKVRSNQLVSEISLWTSWVHVGDLCSTEHGRSFSISAIELINVLNQHPASHTICSSYASRFCASARTVRDKVGTDQLLELMSFATVLDTETESSPPSPVDSPRSPYVVIAPQDSPCDKTEV